MFGSARLPTRPAGCSGPALLWETTSCRNAAALFPSGGRRTFRDELVDGAVAHGAHGQLAPEHVHHLHAALTPVSGGFLNSKESPKLSAFSGFG
jgi:hypothetical protein